MILIEFTYFILSIKNVMIKIKSKKLFDLLNYIYNFKKESINNIITYGSPLEQYIIYTKYI